MKTVIKLKKEPKKSKKVKKWSFFEKKGKNEFFLSIKKKFSWLAVLIFKTSW